MTTFQKLSLALAITLGLVPAFAFAQTSINANAGATVTAGNATVSASTTARLTAAETKAKQRADQEIKRRIDALNDLNTRVGQMQEVSAQFKSQLSGNIQNEISALTSLQAKIDADTDSATLKTDIQTITKSYRIYALVLPQARIAAAADRIVTLVSMMSTIGAKLQARIAAAPSGSDTAALTAALNDMSAKLTDAQTQAQAAVSATISLQPDNGDKAAMASTTATLKTGRSALSAAMKDLAAARKDVGTIISGLAKLPGNNAGGASANASSSASVNH